MSGIAFTSTTLQSYFNSNSSAATTFRNNADLKSAILMLDQRIAAMEVALIPANNPEANDNFPYDKERLKREFLDEVLSLLLSAAGDTNVTGGAGTGDYSVEYTIVYRTGTNGAGTATVTASAREILESLKVTTYRPLLPSDITSFAVLQSNASPLANQTLTTVARVSPSTTAVVVASATAILAEGGTNSPFDQLTLEQKMLLLNADGRSIYQHYAGYTNSSNVYVKGLIDLVFDEGQKMGDNPRELNSSGQPTSTFVNATLITAISPRYHTINNETKLFTHVTTINGQTYLVEAGAEVYQVEKKVVNNTAGVASGFNLGFTESLPTTGRTYVPVDGDMQPIAGGTTLTAPVRNLTIMEFLYFWNEARIKVMRGKLAYDETVTREIQEDLRQANEALGDLEKMASEAKAQDKDSGKPNPNNTIETLKLDLWESRVSQSGDPMFDTEGTNDIPDDSHNYGQWAENRTNLKNYIDRKSAQAQEAMLDYQTTLNRYNNAFEVMAKMQEKLDGVIKGQIRNVA